MTRLACGIVAVYCHSIRCSRPADANPRYFRLHQGSTLPRAGRRTSSQTLGLGQASLDAHLAGGRLDNLSFFVLMHGVGDYHGC